MILVLDLNPGASDQDLNPGALDLEPRCSQTADYAGSQSEKTILMFVSPNG